MERFGDTNLKYIKLTGDVNLSYNREVIMPYPNEHSCRLRDPDDFKEGSFRRTTRKSDGKEYSIILGRLKGEDTMTEQAYRYGKEVWTESEARTHCEEHDGILFEPATGKGDSFWNTTPPQPHRKPDRYLYSVQEYAFISDDEIEVIATSGEPNRLNEVMPASSLKTVDYMKNPIVLWAHNWYQLPIGKTTQIRVKGKQLIHRILFSPTELGQQVKMLYKNGFLNAWSIGFIINAFRDEKALYPFPVRVITDAELLELSACNVPADPNALSTKSFYAMPNLELGNGVQLRGVIPYKETPKADEGEEWDATKKVADAEVDDLKIMCAWFDGEYPNIKSSYKLPHHKAAGEHAVVWRAVAAAGAAIMGARGGVDLPAGDVAGVKAHLAKHYEEFDKEPPWEREASVSSWARKVERMEHLVKELRTGKKDSPVDLEILQEIMSITLGLRANIGQEDLVEVMMIIGSLLGKEDVDVGGVLDGLTARQVSTKTSSPLTEKMIEVIRSIDAEQGALKERLERLGR